MTGWANYIDNHLVKDKSVISRACIFGYKGGVLLWDKSNLFRIKDADMNEVVTVMQDPTRGSLTLGDTKYIVTVNDGDSLYLRSVGLGRPAHGLVCAKTMRAIVTAQYEGYRPQAFAADVVECLADYLVDQSY